MRKATLHRGGFTLTELLVVISIMALLMAILLPSLAGARDKARTTICLSNLRQMNIAFYMYMYDNDGFTVPRSIGQGSSTVGGPPNYPYRSDGTTSAAYWSDQILLGQYAANTNGDNMHPQFINGSVSRRSPFICPSDMQHPPTEGNAGSLSYGMPGDFPSVKAPKYYAALLKFNATVSPLTEMEFVDSISPLMTPGGFNPPYSFYGCKEPLINGNWFDNDPNSNYNWARRHGKGNNGANVMFLDGHATTIDDLKAAYQQGEITVHRVD